MSVLLLNEDEVRQVLSMDMALEAVENGLRKLALDEGPERASVQNADRSRHAARHVGVGQNDRLHGLQGLHN